MKADLNEKAVKAFGILFAIQHAPRLGLDPQKLHDQEIAVACGVALFRLCKDYHRFNLAPTEILSFPLREFKNLSKSAVDELKRDIPGCDIKYGEVFRYLTQGCEKLNIIHEYPKGMYCLDDNFISYYENAVNTMPEMCYGEC